MKKRSKIRLKQDDFPWIRAPQKLAESEQADAFEFPLKQTSRWTAGAQRELETTVLNKQKSVDFSKMLIKSFMFDQTAVNNNVLYNSQIQYKLSKLHRLSSVFRSKNTCFFVGRGRTFNRSLFVARHTLRKLVKFGMIPGLKKS